jgi:hypothetical protein
LSAFGGKADIGLRLPNHRDLHHGRLTRALETTLQLLVRSTKFEIRRFCDAVRSTADAWHRNGSDVSGEIASFHLLIASPSAARRHTMLRHINS